MHPLPGALLPTRPAFSGAVSNLYLKIPIDDRFSHGAGRSCSPRFSKRRFLVKALLIYSVARPDVKTTAKRLKDEWQLPVMVDARSLTVITCCEQEELLAGSRVTRSQGNQ